MYFLTTKENKMNVSRLIKALQKAGLEVKKIEGYERRFECKNSTHILDFHESNHCPDEAQCVHVQKINDLPNMYSDYFPGYFCKTIKQAVKSMTE
jgi:hypothetical protein